VVARGPPDVHASPHLPVAGITIESTAHLRRDFLHKRLYCSGQAIQGAGLGDAVTSTSVKAEADAAGPSSAARRTDLDVLRILLCGGIILAHALLIFAEEPRYHLKSEVPSAFASVTYEFFRAATMPLFFALAGWSALPSLRGRSLGRFLQDRTVRLLIPLIAGTILFGSVIKYVELTHGRDLAATGLRLIEPLQAGFFEFFPRNLKHIKQQTWSHLWFLGYQCLISLILLPLLLWLARRTPVAKVPPAYVVYLPALPIAALLVQFNGYWPFLPSLINDGANFCFYALCVLTGALVAAWPGFEHRLRAEAMRMTILLALAFTGVVLCGESTLGRVFVAFTAWSAIGSAFGLAPYFRTAVTPGFVYLRDAAAPVYIVHHAPLLLLGAAVLPLSMPDGLKIVIICLTTTVVSMAAYHWLIRPWPPMRWLMGMAAFQKPRPVISDKVRSAAEAR
jgi:glucan biosynthesis protein C